MRAITGIYAVLGTALLLGGSAAGVSEPMVDRADEAGPSCRGFYIITRLDIDYLGDDIDPPRAFAVNSGAASGEVRFRVFGTSDDPRYYCDVTPLFRYSLGRYFRGRLQVKVHGLGHGRRNVKGREPEFSYDEEQNAIVYRPRPATAFGRVGTGTLDFRLTLRSPRTKYTTHFVLTLQRG